MLRRFFHSQFFSKLFIELLPATIASAIGAYLINSYFRPAPPPAATAASAEMVQLLREQQALLADYLKKSSEAHQRADQAVAQETDRLKTAERDAIAALREAKAAELRALAAAVARTSEVSERKLAAKPVAAPAPALPAQWPQTEKAQTDRTIAGEPLQRHEAASTAPQPQIQGQAQPHAQTQAQTQAQVQAQQVPPPANAPAPASDNAVLGTLKRAVSAVERLPSRAFDWFSDTVTPPRPPSDLPPSDLPPRQFMKAVM